MSAGYAVEAVRGDLGTGMSRIGGFGGLGFALGVLIQNAVLSRGGPLPDATPDEVARHFAEAGFGSVATVALVAINMPLLFLFGSAAREKLKSGATGEVMSRIGVMGIVLLSAMFGATAIFQSVLIAGGKTLAARLETTELLWDLHTSGLLFSQLALGLTLFGFSSASLAGDGLTPRWLSWVGIAGSAALALGGMFSVASLEGSPVFFVAFPGFFIWMVWLTTASVALAKR